MRDHSRRHRPRAAAATALALIGLLAFAGCGGGKSDEEVRREALRLEAEQRKERFEALMEAKAEELRRRRAGRPLPVPDRFTGNHAVRYETDRWICSALPPDEMAEGLKLDDDSDLETIARAHSKTWPEEYRQASYQGCLAGLRRAEAEEGAG